ncbi:ABC transporter ATP-binding protein [Pontiella sulfatireligans]|uniref:Fe(3+) dicitrate transport ATP-binding protein FecE n=1 Tax=Pontiella sulfatireligans TaxID=2750658 RepID=A0A6C2UIB9_9BACT|nr:ABC transporter ATP-binding protein [Pontiella sulfatireligans]VGO19940.1 Fe(3+) dicitrate transport ATP-binding protein FecE [Pontiella sulfatireligans]
MLQVENLCFAYGKHPVLQHVNFSVKPGELLAVLGPNGAGKSTLLKCINGIRRPQSGTIHMGEQNLMQMHPGEIARTIGYVPQRIDTTQLTVFDAVLLGRKPYLQWRVGPHDMGKVHAALTQLGLESLALRHTDELSGGELQKVAIARALVQEPRLLLFDEPISALDLQAQVHILGFIRRVISEHDLAAVMTMHDLNMALRYANRIVFLKDGAIRYAGGREQISPSIIEEVYGLPVTIHYINQLPVVLPIGDPRNEGKGETDEL